VVIGGSNGAPELADLVIASTTNSAPEIDSTSAASGIALLLGALAVLSGRRRQRVAA
jgi:MYXO-CTERM domain-containing protein